MTCNLDLAVPELLTATNRICLDQIEIQVNTPTSLGRQE